MKQLKKQNRLEPLVIFLQEVHAESSLGYLDEHGIGYVETDLSTQPVKRETQNFLGYVAYALKHTFSLFYTQRRVREILDDLPPAFIVTGTEVFYADRFFLHEAKRRGIPSLCLFSVLPDKKDVVEQLRTVRNNIQGRFLRLLHHVYNTVLENLGMPFQRIPTPSRGEATKISVWNEYQKEILIERGGIPNKIIVTGCPAHDLIYERLMNPSDEIRNKIGELLIIPQDKEIILFGTQPLVADNLCTFEEQRGLTELVIETCAKFDKCILVIKRHPRELAKEYAYLDEHPLRERFRLVSDRDAELYDLIEASRVLITLWSTIATDAILFDRDVVTINLIGMEVPLDYAESGAALGVYQDGKLFDALDRIFNDENVQQELRRGRRRFIDEYLPTFDGKAADRVVALIYQLLEESPY